MAENNDVVFSLISAGAAFPLLYWQGCTYSALFIFFIFMYFLSKLRGVEKIVAPPDFKVLIIGSGVSGICMGKKLNDVGIKYTILEKSANLGGTWYDNIYPGVACDVPSHLYSFSFFLNPFWSRAFSKGKEIHEYLQAAASKFGVYPHVQYEKHVSSATWDKKTNLWTVLTKDGSSYTANILISGCGGLHVPRFPDYKGMDLFKGESFHTALWNKDFDPTNKRIAVLGTGASAVQAVPNLAEMGVKSLTVFQRTPCWAPPRFDYEYPEYVKTIFNLFPFTNTLLRYFYFWRNEFRFRIIFTKSAWITQKLSAVVHKQVRGYCQMMIKDKELASKLIPDYDMGCKRITPSDTYLQAFNKDNVHLVTDKISEITETCVRTADGREHEIDALIYATGFDLLKSAKPFTQVGLQGKPLHEIFDDAPYAYLGIAHDNNPNCFWLLGPGTGLGHNSIIYMIECEANYTIDAIRKMLAKGAKSMVVKKHVQRNYWDWVQDNMKGKVFADNSACTGWYRNSRGVNWTLWPQDLVSYWWKTKSCDLQDYNLSY
ncbi:uncharacterized protein LOC111701982 [Eurytemora carolleeae]|uniref:uncharacterized protein LOC111701982 n=1 Tax=Eurytemora carolleeae TaxID=1294199 RepID=UPI000C78ECDE|nr:uncharacterized protein LOC111701982 [Eurytemora carolleeae]|eukprot:XP_023329259.1 uncharacterized protein LOC111701982 [Eurytemora affinis]